MNAEPSSTIVCATWKDPPQLLIIGDSAMDFSIELRLSGIGSCFEEIIQLPQHTYITTPNADWCLVFTMEGDMLLRTRPPRNHATNQELRTEN